MRIAICNRATLVVENIVQARNLADVAALYPDRDCVPMVADTHPGEPGAVYSRQAAVCRITRGGRTVDEPFASSRLGT